MSFSAKDYTVACICPMGVELAPVQAMLDEEHAPIRIGRDYNNYTLGSIGQHNVVIAVLPKIGINAASKVALEVMEDFPAIRFGLLVGLGGGVPDNDDDEEEEEDAYDIRLGDVVVSKPTKGNSGVVQYDIQTYEEHGKLEQTGALQEPPSLLLSTVEILAARHRRLGSRIPEYLTTMLERFPNMADEYTHPGIEHDQLFHSDYSHVGKRTCRSCDVDRIVKRTTRRTTGPRLHYGTIASANTVIRDAILRDQLRRTMHVKCVEMEAAGLMESFPCLVIRGICDYADSHKNKKWQSYAAATAAAYVKELLQEIIPREVMDMGPAIDLVASAPDHNDYVLGLNLFNAPDTGKDLFIGREEYFDHLDHVLQSDHPQDRRVVVLGGMGGIGKSQIAIQYARRTCQKYESIFWLNAATETTLKASLSQVVNLIMSKTPTQITDNTNDDDHVKGAFLRWFSQPHNTGWLLIFDDHDDPTEYNIQSYYPAAAQGTIFVTTRRPKNLVGTQVHVETLNHKEGRTVLMTRCKRSLDSDDHDVDNVVYRLGGLPLALATAGTYLRDHPIGFEQYLQEYETHWNLDPRSSATLLDYRPDRTLYTTWDFSYETLQKEDQTAANMLKLLAYFDDENIRYELLRAGISDQSPRWLLDVTDRPRTFSNVMGKLVDACFVKLHLESQSYHLHRCISDWLLMGLNWTPSPSNYDFASQCIIGMFPEDSDFLSLCKVENGQLVPHALRLGHQRFLGIRRKGGSAKRCEDLGQIAGLLHAQGLFAEAQGMYSEALTVKQSLLDYGRVSMASTISTMNELARLYLALDQLSKAQEMLVDAWRLRAKHIRVPGVIGLATYHNLADLYCRQNKLDQAEQTCDSVLVKTKEIFGAQHAATLSVVSTLGQVYTAQGKLDAAERMFEDALSSRQSTLGTNHTSTFITVFRLGLVQLMKNKLEEAEEGCSKALPGLKQAIGAHHLLTLEATRILATVYARQGKLEHAGMMLNEVMSTRERLLGRKHSATKMVAYQYSLVLQRQGDSEGAQSLLEGYDIEDKIKEQVDKEMAVTTWHHNIVCGTDLKLS